MFNKGGRVIRILALVAFVLSVVSIGYEIAASYNERVAKEQNERSAMANDEPSFGIYGDYGDRRKWKRLILVPLTFVAFRCIRRYSFVSLALYGASVGLFFIWLRHVYNIITIDWNLFSDKSPIEIALLAANPFDYALFGAVLVLFMSLMFTFFLVDMKTINQFESCRDQTPRPERK